jgi:hypothetical protein
MLKPEPIIQIWDADFKMLDFIKGYKQVIVNKSQEVSVLDQLQVYIIMAAFGVAALILSGVAYIIAWPWREKIFEKVKGAVNKFMWNGYIRSQDISFL